MQISAYFGMFLLLFALQAHSNEHPVPITLLHTNDLHSHFRPDRGPLNLGGIARLKTAIQKLREAIPHTLLLDGGDWSEGNIFYNEGAGVEALKMMDRLGYDIAVVGNHDWLNGPDVLLESFEQASPKTTFLSANLSPENYEHKNSFQKWILPYVIREVEGVKIAFFGLSTYELVYDGFISPVTIQEPFLVAREVAAKLKKQADVVVAISHHSILMNKGILKIAPAIDLIIGAHDHVKLTSPVVVERFGAKPGWIVEAGCWGHYLGRVDLTVSPGGKVSLDHSELIQMDSSVPEDPEINSEIEVLENRLESRYGPIFHDLVGINELEMSRTGIENDMGNLATDAYLAASNADFALDSSRFINGVLHEGPVRSVDVFNSNPSIYNPVTQKAWTLKVLPFKGSTLKWLLSILFGTTKFSAYGLVSASGLSFIYDPLFNLTAQSETLGLLSPMGSPLTMPLAMPLTTKETMDPSIALWGDAKILNPQSIPVIRDVRVRGTPMDDKKVYNVAIGSGLVRGLEYINSYWNIVPLENLKDLGVENWRVMADFIRSHSPLTRDKLPVGNRIRPLQADLGVLYDAIQWQPLQKTGNELSATVTIQVKNFGSSPSPEGTLTSGPRLRIVVNQNGLDYSKSPLYEDIGEVRPIPVLQAGEKVDFKWEVKAPANKSLFAVTAKLEGIQTQIEHNRDEVTHWFNLDHL